MKPGARVHHPTFGLGQVRREPCGHFAIDCDTGIGCHFRDETFAAADGWVAVHGPGLCAWPCDDDCRGEVSA